MENNQGLIFFHVSENTLLQKHCGSKLSQLPNKSCPALGIHVEVLNHFVLIPINLNTRVIGWVSELSVRRNINTTARLMQMELFWKLRSSAILEEEKHHLVHVSRESEIEKA